MAKPAVSERSAAPKAAVGHKPVGAFRSKNGHTEHTPKTTAQEVNFLRNTVDFVASFTPKPKGRQEIPLLPMAPPIGSIDEKGVLRFDNVPQTLTPSDGTAIPAPSDEFLTSPQGKLWWAEGRAGEPRILARNNRGEVVARYALDGQCVVGEGFPPIAYASKPSADTPIHIVPGAREWFLLQEIYAKKFKDTPEKQPHVVWGAPDVDWKHVAKGMRDRQVVIIRSKHDQGQIPWAQALETELRERWGLKVSVAPRISEPQVEPEARAPSRLGMGGRRR